MAGAQEISPARSDLRLASEIFAAAGEEILGACQLGIFALILPSSGAPAAAQAKILRFTNHRMRGISVQIFTKRGRHSELACI